MPRTRVIPIARTNCVRSSRRIAQTPIWQVTELVIRIAVRIAANHGSPWRLNRSASSGATVGGWGGHGTVDARTLKYAANSPEKNITSEQMNRIIPRIGLLIPPRVSWARPATGVASLVG